jgi:hypothetical protein
MGFLTACEVVLSKTICKRYHPGKSMMSLVKVMESSLFPYNRTQVISILFLSTKRDHNFKSLLLTIILVGQYHELLWNLLISHRHCLKPVYDTGFNSVCNFSDMVHTNLVFN